MAKRQAFILPLFAQQNPSFYLRLRKDSGYCPKQPYLKVLLYQRFRRRRNRPAKPAPNPTMLAGSGTGFSSTTKLGRVASG